MARSFVAKLALGAVLSTLAAQPLRSDVFKDLLKGLENSAKQELQRQVEAVRTEAATRLRSLARIGYPLRPSLLRSLLTGGGFSCVPELRCEQRLDQSARHGDPGGLSLSRRPDLRCLLRLALDPACLGQLRGWSSRRSGERLRREEPLAGALRHFGPSRARPGRQRLGFAARQLPYRLDRSARRGNDASARDGGGQGRSTYQPQRGGPPSAAPGSDSCCASGTDAWASSSRRRSAPACSPR